MNHALIRSLGFTLMLAPVALHAADDPSWRKAADNHVQAQRLVERVLADDPSLAVLALHAKAPGAADETIIAANLDRIGKKDDDDDLSVGQEHRIILAPNPSDDTKYEVLVPLRDSTQRFIGVIGIVFHYRPGTPELDLLRHALSIRDRMAGEIPDLASLFQKSE